MFNVQWSVIHCLQVKSVLKSTVFIFKQKCNHMDRLEWFENDSQGGCGYFYAFTNGNTCGYGLRIILLLSIDSI